MPKAKQYDKVVLLEAVGDFPKGAWGAVIEVYTTPYEAYDVEIMTGDGQTIGIADALLPNQFEVEESHAVSAAMRFQSIQAEEEGRYATILFSNGMRVTVSAVDLYARLETR